MSSNPATNGDNLIGKTIGQYTILEEIGRGGMATVYSAMQASMNRKVAIKVLPRHFLHDPGFLERFEREVEVISRLEHPHILPIYDFGNADGVPFIAMRYLGGGSMAQMIRRGVPPINDIEKPFTQVAQALDYAHQQGIIHRDLKPGNIMLDEGGNAYLSDFGIARVMGSELTGSAIIGTPAYMSPEQAHGMTIDARSDVYALGIVLFELLTGREPYQSETPMGVLLMHVNEPMPAVSDFRSDVPARVEDVIEKATAKDRDLRYSSAGELARAFSEALRDKTPATRRAPQNVEPPTMPPTPTPLRNQGGTVVGTSDMGIASASVPSPVGDVMSAATAPQATAPQATAPHATALPPSEYSNRGGKIILGLMLVTGLLAVVVLVLPQLLTAPASEVEEPIVAVPTPFSRASAIETERYSISMPQLWLPDLTDFSSVSVPNGIRHFWRNDDQSVRVDVILVTMDEAIRAINFAQDTDSVDNLLERFTDRTLAELRENLIDVAVAEDGTVRRSYRMPAHEDFVGGQFDVFLQRHDDQFSALLFYTENSIAGDDAVIQILQLILDSFRVKPSL